ncbi:MULTISPECIES: bile acid:sodium symporter family protein [Corynebacterium]|uniref:BASS family bile acid:Na+ symporter n=1 Tax=Corynebacterium freneyi TaxID=134034 RepID=A0ABS4U8B3_9CORY|nr:MULTISPECIES: bile acid:sodium symporter family protein [Corynebacterium]MBP2332899.1 BASS family bile acid:Na+ symporter [Corynebacterium freneyi]OFU53144.1 bile acid:sodium symporter [Corynebacterium sp. HMSC11E11]QXA52979.1 bile acid:sodium symporter family protein [Corynebacterium freneyi]UBI03158.1 bile acid:sodium symporter family protein [Corynebacterium freneyi]WJZ04997.1 Sodium Bile acid symporter family protein [Corynebacterium freneyi]
MQDSPVIAIGLPVALAVIMVGIGLSLTLADFREQARTPRATIIGTLGQVFLVPAIGIAVALVMDLPPIMALGLVLVAACPGGSTSNLVTYLARGNVALSIILTVVASLVIIVTLPGWLDVAGRILPGATELSVSVPLGQTFGLLIGIILIPVAIGMVIRAKKPELAAKLERGMSVFGALVLLLAIGAVAVDLGGEIIDMTIVTGPAVLVFNIAVILVGGALAWIARVDRASQLALAVEYGIKNSTLGLVIALTVVRDEEFAVPAAVYSIVMYVTAIAVIAIGRRMIATSASQSNPDRNARRETDRIAG